ncbi:MAG: SLBB domain-containing protein [Acidobacteriota bacterium]|nr:SLBB domain-containing protein [Acidobacteriota bacterium]MDH3528501.1 SLBB domain-containing protein [Acidobacteriota bacterium]
MLLRKLLAITNVFVLTGILSAAFSAQENDKPKDEAKPDTVKILRAGEEPAEVANRGADLTSERYKIGFEDVIQINVYRHPDLSQTVTVARDGTIILPRIDEPIHAVCKTERELASLITALYRNYLRNPFVNVRALEQRSQPFAVIGAVNKPGSFYLSHRVRLLELLALAGGPDYEKSGARIQVARVDNLSACKVNDDSPGEVEFFAYSVSDVLKGKENPFMLPGDIVSILEAEEAYVVGNVEEPTTIQLKEPITLTEAIAKAGGLGPVARTSTIVIQRREPGSKVKTELVYDLKEIRAQKVDDPYLKANDIVQVPTSNSKVIRNGLLKVLTGGLSNLFYRFPI